MVNMGMISPPLKPKPNARTVSSAFTAKSPEPAVPASAPCRSGMPVPSKRCQDSASTRPAISSPPASTASTGRPTRRRMRRRSTLRAAANSAPAPAQAKPTTRHAAAVSHESAGSATFGMTSPMPMGLAMANATNEARSIVAAWRTTGPLNRMSFEHEHRRSDRGEEERAERGRHPAGGGIAFDARLRPAFADVLARRRNGRPTVDPSDAPVCMTAASLPTRAARHREASS